MRQISDINLTPLMDLTFILLITFIITFPLIEQGISINLPKADADETVRYGKLREVMKILHASDITKMSLVTAAESQ